MVLLTDMLGNTPANLALSAMNSPKLEAIAGVNLPMLVKLVSVRDSKTLAESVVDAQKAGRKYISVASKVLEERSG